MKGRTFLGAAAVFALTVVAVGCGGSQSSDRDRNVSAQPTCAQGGPCAVGDFGPGGGIIFATPADGGAYLEAAPVNGLAQWGCLGRAVKTTGTFGSGDADTASITKCGDTDDFSAAHLADSLEYGGVSDWYLPSVAELKALYSKRDKFECDDSRCTAVVPDADYWSSTAAPEINRGAVYVSFADGSDNIDDRLASMYVRPIRKFTITVPTTTTAAPTTTTSTTTTTVAPTTTTIPRTTTTASTTTTTVPRTTTTPPTTTTTVPRTTTTPPTTTTTVPRTTTTPPTTTTTVPRTTTTPPTTVSPTTTLGPNDCRISYASEYFTFCQSVTEYAYEYYDATDALSGRISATASMPLTRLRVPLTYYPTATRMRFTLVFTNGGRMDNTFVPVNSSGTSSVINYTTPPPAPTTTQPSCGLSITWSALTACKTIKSYDYQWWDNSKSLSGNLGASSGGSGWATLYFGGMSPPQGTTQVLITLRFTDGSSIKPLKIPYGQAGTVSVTAYFA